uniref:Uncharacterized protein n=1 Tax=Bicosoecida sp. CB-2014 TaxID=1486930 RepID=A0A7S1GAX2_9STRA|mmetsp:Transcript_2441/g.8280  ORF Transcript_2441/g.8280 Transcript_2441/m.8280 type:complete len:285 (+) Transcript_2441:139-993(+)
MRGAVASAVAAVIGVAFVVAATAWVAPGVQWRSPGCVRSLPPPAVRANGRDVLDGGGSESTATRGGDDSRGLRRPRTESKRRQAAAASSCFDDFSAFENRSVAATALAALQQCVALKQDECAPSPAYVAACDAAAGFRLCGQVLDSPSLPGHGVAAKLCVPVNCTTAAAQDIAAVYECAGGGGAEAPCTVSIDCGADDDDDVYADDDASDSGDGGSGAGLTSPERVAVVVGGSVAAVLACALFAYRCNQRNERYKRARAREAAAAAGPGGAVVYTPLIGDGEAE